MLFDNIIDILNHYTDETIQNFIEFREVDKSVLGLFLYLSEEDIDHIYCTLNKEDILDGVLEGDEKAIRSNVIIWNLLSNDKFLTTKLMINLLEDEDFSINLSNIAGKAAMALLHKKGFGELVIDPEDEDQSLFFPCDNHASEIEKYSEFFHDVDVN